MAKTNKAVKAKVKGGRPSAVVDTRVVYCGDNLEQLKKLPDGCVDLIYIDPPFNSNRNYEVFWGETKEKRAFEDRHASTQAYIEFMRPRCIELHRVLKDTGSFYFHCDWHASHYVKIMLDQIFSENQFKNEIVWSYSGWNKQLKDHLERRHDVILFYAKGKLQTFNYPTRPWESREEYVRTRKQKVRVDENEREYVLSDAGKGKRVKRYLDEAMAYGVPLDDVWSIPKLNNSDKIERLGYPTQKPLALLERIVKASSNANDIVLDAFCGCGTALVAAENLGRQWIGIDVSPTACRVMAKRLRDVCKIKEDEKLWRIGRGFVVRDLPWSEKKLREIPPFEFENWAVIALGGIPNKAQVGDMGIDGRIYPVSAVPKKAEGEFDFMDVWYPIQVKQKDKAGRPDIDAFEAVMMREDRQKGFFVSFDYTGDAISEIQAFFKRTGKSIVALTVKDILEEQIAHKLA